MSKQAEPNRAGGSPVDEVKARERGQIIPMAIMMLVTFFCLCGFSIDAGKVYISYAELQASTDASALAGAAGLPSSSAAVANANLYSSVSGNNNAFANMSGVTMVTSPKSYPLVECLAALQAQGIACDGTTSYNAIQVKQTATIPMTFARFFGTNNVTITASATAAARGAISTPYNIAVVIDTTGSMGTSPDSCTDPSTGTKYTTRIKCALVGLKILLLNTAPCAAALSSCPGGTTNAVDMISVFTFPNATVGSAANDYSNGCTGATTALTYSFPIAGATSYVPANPPTSTATYEITSFLSDYRSSDASTTVSTSSNLGRLLGSISGASCAGMTAPGGLKTYYAGAITAAQSALYAQSQLSARAGSKNAMIILSDGDSNADSTKMATKDTAGNAVSTTASTYPSIINQCQQGIAAAAAATAAGTTVYSVAYGASTTPGCSFDISGTLKGLSPCTAMTKMASSASTFFSDNSATGGDSGCTSAQQPSTGLATIFGQIASDFTVPRLIPDGTT